MALEVNGLVAAVDSKKVLDNVSLRVERRKLLVLMGPNGSGKTSLAYVIMGHPGYRVLKGRITLDGEDITSLPTYERARRGIMLAFQEPVEVKGVKLLSLLAAAHARLNGGDFTRPNPDLIKTVEPALRLVGLRWDMLDREVNVGFSGGEKKRSEILQILVLKPKYAILDEPDSGLDVDGVKAIAKSVETMIDEGTGVILITHYARIVRYLVPDSVAVIVSGRIVARGGTELIEEVERNGYQRFIEEVAWDG